MVILHYPSCISSIFKNLKIQKKKSGFPGEAFTAETKKSNFRIEYLREFEIKFENTLACESGA